MSQSEKRITYTLKGSIILVSFAAAQVCGTIAIQYLFNTELSPEMMGIFLVCSFLIIPGGFYLGRAVSTQLITNPYYELEDSNQQETLITTEKALKDLVKDLEEKNQILTKSSSILENFTSKVRIVALISGASFLGGIGFVFLIVNLFSLL